MVLTLLVASGIVALGAYVALRHQDRAATVAAILLAAGALGAWFVSTRERDQLEAELAASQEEIAELEAGPAQRGFAAGPRTDLVDALSSLAGPTAFVLANSSDLETTEYAREIGSILNEAGWEVPPSFGMMYRPVLLPGQDEVPPGVILGLSDEISDSLGMEIYRAFREAGVDIQFGPHWPGTENPISILVGPSR